MISFWLRSLGLIFFCISIGIVAAETTLKKNKPTKIPKYSVGDWAEWVVKSSLAFPVASGVTEETREHLLDVAPAKEFRIRITVLNSDSGTYQFKSNVYHSGKTTTSVQSVSPREILADLPTCQDIVKVVSREKDTLLGTKTVSLRVITEITPQSGKSYLIKRWEIPKLAIGPARLEYPGGSVMLVANGNGKQPKFPIDNSPIKKTKKQ